MLSHNLVTLMANPTFNEYLGVNYVALIFVDVLRQKTNQMINVISLKGHALHAMPFTSSLSIKFFMPKCQNCKTLQSKPSGPGGFMGYGDLWGFIFTWFIYNKSMLRFMGIYGD